jgi:hypothetical protein
MTHALALGFFLVSATFVWRSFYKMRIVKTFDAVEAEKATAGV